MAISIWHLYPRSNTNGAGESLDMLYAIYPYREDARYAYDGLGVFEGAYTYLTGAYRPTDISIMRHNTGGFNAPSREAIYQRIHRLAYGKSWTYDYETFVEYDAKNRKSAPQALKSSLIYSECPHTTPPVIIRRNWRDIVEEYAE